MAAFNLDNQDQIIDDQARAWDDLDAISATGTSAQTLANFTSTASGTETVTGTSAQTLTNFTSTTTATETISGTSAQTLQDFTSTASGTVTVATVTTTSQGGGNKSGFLRRHTRQWPSEIETENDRRRRESELLVLT